MSFRCWSNPSIFGPVCLIFVSINSSNFQILKCFVLIFRSNCPLDTPFAGWQDLMLLKYGYKSSLHPKYFIGHKVFHCREILSHTLVWSFANKMPLFATGEKILNNSPFAYLQVTFSFRFYKFSNAFSAEPNKCRGK